MRRTLIVLAMLFLGVSLLSGCRPSVQPECANPDDRMRRIGAIPMAVARKCACEGTDDALAMLENVKDAPYWPNALRVLGASRNAALVKPLIDFIHGNPVDMDLHAYRGGSAAVAALGQLVRDTGDARAEGYLRDSVDPEVWSRRDIPWLRARGDKGIRWAQNMSEAAIRALAVAGTYEAMMELANLWFAPGTSQRHRRAAARGICRIIGVCG